MVNLQSDDGVLASLPFFHSFGCTVTLWFPIIEGLRAVTYPNPLDVTKNAELVKRYACSMFLATPTFLRSYLRKVDAPAAGEFAVGHHGRGESCRRPSRRRSRRSSASR